MLGAVHSVLDTEQQLRHHLQLADTPFTQDPGQKRHVANALQGIEQQILKRRVHMAELRRSLEENAREERRGA